MPALISTATLPRPVLLVGLIAALLVTATLGLWAYNGTAVFFEVIRTGWIACF